MLYEVITVALEDILRVEKLAGEPGDIVELDAVLMLGGESGTTLGTLEILPMISRRKA